MTFQDQLNELQHQIDSLNAKLNHAEGEIMWLRGFLAGNTRLTPQAQPQAGPFQGVINLPYTQPGYGTCAREPNGFDHFDTETGVIRASAFAQEYLDHPNGAIPTTDNDEGPEALAAQQQAQTDPDDYLGNLV